MVDDTSSTTRAASDQQRQPLPVSTLERNIRDYGKHHVLAVGPQANSLVDHVYSAQDSTSTTTLHHVAVNPETVAASPQALRELAGTTRFDCAVVSDLPHQLTEREWTSVVAIVRDQLASVTLLILDYDESLHLIRDTACCSAVDLTALGFRRMGWHQIDNVPIVVFGHNIADYKTTPDWLNPKNWANPQRWNKDRW